MFTMDGQAPPARKARILFVAEAVSLANVVRFAKLASALDTRRFEVWFASSHFPEVVFAGTRFNRRRIWSQAPEHTLARVARGRRPWNESTLASYVASDN